MKVKNLRATIMDQLDTALAQHAPPPIPDDPTLYELPPLILDGIPTPVEKMTQAQLRAFIPLMLKYSTGEKLNIDFICNEVSSIKWSYLTVYLFYRTVF